MAPDDTADQVVELERTLGLRWESIRGARERAFDLRRRLQAAIAPLVPEDASVVVFGSLARNEFTSGSDIDWTLLVDGLANPRHHDDSLTIDDRVREFGKGPGERERSAASRLATI
ncbi:MAG: nucleotidyltransferase domain-containing protein [Isosphaeraceae bacterium]|nr:nucleotidyltransferase domain-containing protein [Isosphaeraceae bacterium]